MWWETSNVWRMEGYYIMIMPPIKLKTTLEPFFFNNCYGALVQMFFLTHCFSILGAQWHLSISMHKLTSVQFVIIATCGICSCVTLSVVYIVVMSPLYSFNNWKLVEEDSWNWPFEFLFNKKQVDIGSHVHIGSKHKVLGSFRV